MSGAEKESNMDFLDYIVDKVLYIIPVLYALGMIIKGIPKIPNWLIPIILLAIGIAFSGCIVGWTADGIVQGVLVTAAAVFTNQVVKQVKARE